MYLQEACTSLIYPWNEGSWRVPEAQAVLGPNSTNMRDRVVQNKLGPTEFKFYLIWRSFSILYWELLYDIYGPSTSCASGTHRGPISGTGERPILVIPPGISGLGALYPVHASSKCSNTIAQLVEPL